VRSDSSGVTCDTRSRLYYSGSMPKRPVTVITSFRLPAAMLKRLDRYAVELARTRPGETFSRADAVRILLARALAEVEALGHGKA